METPVSMTESVSELSGTQLSDMATQQTAGFARRHGWTTTGQMNTDLTSSGWINGVDQGSINRKPNTAGAPQATGASDISVQPNAPVTGTATSATGKSLKAAGILPQFQKYYRGGSDLQKNGAQKCQKCGSCWITGTNHPTRDTCTACGSSEVGEMLAKSSSGGDAIVAEVFNRAGVELNEESRDRIVVGLFTKAARETDRDKKAKFENLAVLIDKVELPAAQPLHRALRGAAKASSRTFGDRHVVPF